MVYNIMRSAKRQQRGADSYDYDKPADVVLKNNFWVTCQVDEDLPYLMDYVTEDRMLVGSDYTHADASQEFNFLEKLQQRADAGEISQAAVGKITSDNGRVFYGL